MPLTIEDAWLRAAVAAPRTTGDELAVLCGTRAGDSSWMAGKIPLRSGGAARAGGTACPTCIGRDKVREDLAE